MRFHRTLLLTAMMLATSLSGVSAQVPSPTVEGPIDVGRFFVAATIFNLADVGYMREEYFIAGTATAFTSASDLTPDGMWTVTPGGTAAYKTRMVIYRPIDAKDFKGTVLVEWLNVSGGLDAAPDWIAAHVEMIRSGMVWVGVSAQFAGVEVGSSGGAFLPPLKGFSPVRYRSLRHPGDSFSYDMYAQAGQAIRDASETAILGGFKVKRLIAIGESQSAFRMTTYINAMHPRNQLYDGFLVHSRGGGAAGLSQGPQPVIEAPTPTLIRTDLEVPVLTFQTETDLFRLGSIASRQPDTKRVRLWEVAGTAHADAYTLATGWDDIRTLVDDDHPLVVGKLTDIVDVVERTSATPIPGLIECDRPINSGPQHWVLNAAIAALDRWVRRGKPPRKAPRLEVTEGPNPSFVLDEHGNVRGGVRTPWVDAPIATLSGEGQTGSTFCGIFGTTVLFDDAKLTSLYPTTRAFVKTHKKATKRALRKRFLRKKDAKLMRLWAKESNIGG